MSISVFDLFSIGIGPSSSHTVGPMRAAAMFVDDVKNIVDPTTITRLEVDLYGSLAATGPGHGTLGAVLLGLEGNEPESIDPGYARDRVGVIDSSGVLRFAALTNLAFDTAAIGMHPLTIKDRHSNTLRFAVHTDANAPKWRPTELDAATAAYESVFYSVGGGFVERHGDTPALVDTTRVPMPFGTGGELLDVCARTSLPISAVMFGNECALRDADDVRTQLLDI